MTQYVLRVHIFALRLVFLDKGFLASGAEQKSGFIPPERNTLIHLVIQSQSLLIISVCVCVKV